MLLTLLAVHATAAAALLLLARTDVMREPAVGPWLVQDVPAAAERVAA